jgi:hypothetical protein
VSKLGVQRGAIPFGEETVPSARTDAQPDIPGLNELALRALVSLFDERTKLFCHRATWTEGGLFREGTSQRRTIIALLGLQRLSRAGIQTPFDSAAMAEAILHDLSWVRSIGDLGLLTWFGATCEPERLDKVLSKFDFEYALEGYSDGRQARTGGLACFLAGIAHARLANAGALPDLTDVALETYRLLEDNQGEGGIFGHLGFPASAWDALGKRFGTFADQVYSIYALTTFAKAFDIEEPLESAWSCANAICALQGAQGQWWFLYDKRQGRVVNQYPVLSLHQDGIGPVGLLALSDATDRRFQNAIRKGLGWVSGGNEFGIDFRNINKQAVSGSVEFRDYAAKYWIAARSLLGLTRKTQVETLRIRYEARPDHFGWMLYAFGGLGLPQVKDAVQAAKAG